MTTAIQFPAVLAAGNAKEVGLVVPASLLARCTSLMGTGTVFTVKLTPLPATPFTVTTTLPVVAPVGTGTTMLVSLQLVGVAAVPLNVTVPVPWVAPKLVPAIATDVPTEPLLGVKLVMFG